MKTWNSSCAGEVICNVICTAFFYLTLCYILHVPVAYFLRLDMRVDLKKKKTKKSRERETRKANGKRVTAACMREAGLVYLRLENTADRYNERISDMLQQRGGGPVIIQIMRRRGCAT